MTGLLPRLLTWLAVLAATPAFAERLEVALDIDRDGSKDLAVLERDADAGVGDLSIWLDAGEGTPDASRKPTLVKRGLAAGGIVSLEANDRGSLLLIFGCGGCSNDYETTLTIVYRGGTFLVGGYSYEWDTRDGAGSCDINFLTGKGLLSEGVDGEPVPVDGAFKPVALADWSEEDWPEVCDPG